MSPGRCPACDAEVVAGARFCASCGTALVPSTDERRVVTVLFGDIVGFTPMSEARDPEHVKNRLDRCFERLAADVRAHGGRVDKIVGDELMAVFGAPVAHEDDPERAVRAALQMQRTLAEEDPDHRLQMRIGVNTGEVLVGSLRAGGDVTALGDVVNTASRLQSAADPGAVLVGATTHAATHAVMRYEDVGPIEVKGKDERVPAWLAIEAVGLPGFRPGRARTPLIGRSAELGMLESALTKAAEHDRPQFVLLVGEAGVGKTRLVEEATGIATSEHDALVLQGRCLPYGEANPWWPVAEALRQACGIESEDPADVAEEKCRRAIAAVVDTDLDEGAEASRVADALLYLMGYGGHLADVEPSRAKDEMIRAIRVSLGANAKRRPLVVVLSEIHWADSLVLDLIDTLLDRMRGLPIVLLATARPELEERWAPKPGRYNLFVINLDPLDRSSASELARTLLGEEPSPEMLDLMVERSGGNPLFLEELVVLLGETEILANEGERVDATRLPATLRGLVAARLDSLSAVERSLIEDAAVIGRRGPVDALRALAEGRGDEDVDRGIESLMRNDLMAVIDGEFEFKSELVCDVAYETLTKGERARRHAAVASWLDAYAGRTEREDEYLERIAHHFAAAAHLSEEIGVVEGLAPDIAEQALSWLERAAERAEERETTAVSVHVLEHALQLIGPEDERRAGFLLSRARGRGSLREMEGASADIAEALEIAEREGDRVVRARALTVRGDVEQKAGDLAASAESLREAVGLWREVGDRRGEAEALRGSGFTLTHMGRLDEAEETTSRALEISRELGDRRGEAWALQNLAWVSFTRGDQSRAEQRLNASANLFHEIGDFGGHAWAIGLLAYVWYFQGRLDDAAAIAENSVDWSREMGDRWAHGMMLNLLASVKLWQGRTLEAVERASEAHRLFQQIDDTMGLTTAGTTLAWALFYAGRTSEALELAEAYLPRSQDVYTARVGAVLTAAAQRTLVGDVDGALALLRGTDEEDEELVAPTRGLALALGGAFEEAYTEAVKGYTLEADPGPRANAACMLSMVAAFAGRAEEAIAAGNEVGRLGGTYLDQIRAHMGRGLGYARLGKTTESETAFASARRLADASEDVVHQHLVRLAEGIVRGRTKGADVVDAARRHLTEMGLSTEPWEQAIEHVVEAAETTTTA